MKTKECEFCGQGEEWRGKKMALILDHINGNHKDNRLENLRILCPNCNATLPTHCGRKNRPARDLRRPNNRKVQRPSLEVLLRQIEAMGYSATGREYGVSDNAIRKWVRIARKYSPTE